MKAGKLLFLFISIMATLCLGSCIFSSDKDDQVHGPITVNIHNFTGHTANGIYIKGTTGTDWGTNYLAGTLVNGAISSDITIPSQLSTSGRFDFLLRTTNDRVFLQSGMAVPPGSQAVTVPFQSAHLFANTESFTVSNQVGFPIVDLRIQPVDSEHWGDNKIQGSLNNGVDLPITLDIPLGVVNRYNIRLVGTNGTTYARVNQPVSQGDVVVFDENHIDGAITAIQLQNNTGQNFPFWRWRHVGGSWTNTQPASILDDSTITVSGLWSPTAQIELQLWSAWLTATLPARTYTQNAIATFTTSNIDNNITRIRLQNSTGRTFNFWVWRTTGGTWSTPQSGDFSSSSNHQIHHVSGAWNSVVLYDIQLRTTAEGGTTATRTAVNIPYRDAIIQFFGVD